MDVSLRQLEYFVAVAEHLSFRNAADACFVTQPGLSSQIKELETLLGVRLFERSQRSVLVTPSGEHLLPLARSMLAAADEFVDVARSLTQPLSGTLRLGVIPTIAPYLLPQALLGLRRSHPQLRILLHEGQTQDLLQLLLHGKLDVLLLALEADLGNVTTFPLAKDHFVLAMAENHGLAKRKLVSQADIAGEQVLLLEDGHCLRDQALEVCHKSGASEIGNFRASSLTTLVQMVAGGIGITLLPQMSLPVEATPLNQLVVKPFQKPQPYRTIGLAWRTTSPREKEFRLLAAALVPSHS